MDLSALKVKRKKKKVVSKDMMDQQAMKKLVQRRQQLVKQHGSLEALIDSPEGDLVLLADGEAVLRVHRDALCELSPYFNAMLNSGMSESTQDSLQVNWPGVVLQAVVYFLFLGKTDVHVSGLVQLAMAADELVLPSLYNAIRMCYAPRMLTLESVLYWYTLGLQMENPTLLQECLALVCTDTEAVLGAAQFPCIDVLAELLAHPVLYLSCGPGFLDDLLARWGADADAEEAAAECRARLEPRRDGLFAMAVQCVELAGTVTAILPGQRALPSGAPAFVSRMYQGAAAPFEELVVGLCEQDLCSLPVVAPRLRKFGVIAAPGDLPLAVFEFLQNVTSYQCAAREVVAAGVAFPKGAMPFPRSTLENTIGASGLELLDLSGKWLADVSKAERFRSLAPFVDGAFVGVRGAVAKCSLAQSSLDRAFAVSPVPIRAQWILGFPTPSVATLSLLLRTREPMLFEVRTRTVWFPLEADAVHPVLQQLAAPALPVGLSAADWAGSDTPNAPSIYLF